MSIDFSIRPVGSPVAAPIVTPQPDGAQTAVATQLPAPQSVTAPDSASASSSTSNNTTSNISPRVVIDQAAASIVYESVNENNGAVVSQYPETWQLKARAYVREQERAKEYHVSQPLNLSV